MQLNNLERVINFTAVKISRFACLLNLTRGNMIVIFITVFYHILHSFLRFFNLRGAAEKDRIIK